MSPLTADREALTAWLSRLRASDGRDVTRGTKATYRAQLRAFYIWLQDTGRRADDPSTRLPQPRPARTRPGR